jgi:hypothetical protein
MIPHDLLFWACVRHRRHVAAVAMARDAQNAIASFCDAVLAMRAPEGDRETRGMLLTHCTASMLPSAVVSAGVGAGGRRRAGPTITPVATPTAAVLARKRSAAATPSEKVGFAEHRPSPSPLHFFDPHRPFAV